MAFKIKANIPAAKPPVDPQPGAKHFDIVLGLDFHVLKVPWPVTPCPVTPFSALVFDPMDYIHCTIPAMPVYDEKGGFHMAKDVPMGGTVLINGFYRGAAQSALWGLPSVPPLLGKAKGLGSIVKALNLLHFVIPQPLFLLPKFFHPHEGQMSHGSETVFTQSMQQSTLLCRAYSCQDVGKILMNNPTGGFYLNFLTAIVAVLPMGKPVMIGGKKTEQELTTADLINSLMFMGITHGVKFAAGKLLKGLKTKFENRRLGKESSNISEPKGGRGPNGFGDTIGEHSKRPFNPENAGGKIENLSWKDVTISKEGIDNVKKHTDRFGKDDANSKMIERLKKIESGEIEATDYDKRYYTHELREQERFRNKGILDNEKGTYEDWNDAHTATLEDYKINEVEQPLYHPLIID